MRAKPRKNIKEQIIQLYKNGYEIIEIVKELNVYHSLAKSAIAKYESQKNASVIFNVDSLDCWICPTLKDID